MDVENIDFNRAIKILRVGNYYPSPQEIQRRLNDKHVEIKGKEATLIRDILVETGVLKLKLSGDKVTHFKWKGGTNTVVKGQWVAVLSHVKVGNRLVPKLGINKV